MKFKSKIDWWANAAFALCPITNIWLLAETIINFPKSIISGICAAFFLGLNIFLIFPIWFKTYYVLGDDSLHIKSGLGKGVKIAYSSIKNIKETKDSLSSPALSLDRISISYEGDCIIISPKDKSEFVKQLENKLKTINER